MKRHGMRYTAAVILAVLSGLCAAPKFGRTGEPSLSTTVSLETRWWNEHEFAWRLGEAAGLRWATVDGISGRGRVEIGRAHV